MAHDITMFSFSQARIVNKSGTRLVDEIARDLKAMLDVRINAVKRIVKVVEDLPKVNENTTDFENYSFVNTRDRDEFREEELRLKRIEDELKERLSQSENYTKKRKPQHDGMICYQSDSPSDDDADEDEIDYGCFAKYNETINLKSKEASVYLPLDVFDKDGNITRIIHRSRGIDKAFFGNYKIDPTIGWQYFCNSSGLFRHFPATSWSFHPINMYDCRMRHWFAGAAASAKDVMILIEISGSMNGTRIGIAIDVVRNILDTLTPNDFVNVIEFSENATYAIPCAKGLIQATSANIFELKQAIADIEPKGQTDLAEALREAFEVLAIHKRSSANCNQVIMLITDGMEYNLTIQDIFRDYNWHKGSNVRVFSFLIGEQIPEGDYEQVKLMACENRGYYTQIDTKKETREQSLKYIPIIARPLVLASQNMAQNPIVWSNLYADVVDSYRITNHDWNCKQSETQRRRVVKYLSEYDWYPCITRNEPEEWNPEYRKYVFMTTVSMPAFERGVNAVRRSHQLLTYSINNEKLFNNSQSLMGVAAVDVALFEFERLFQNFRLGVGGYAFVIDSNGNILTHPEFRPFFQGKILKPSYNSVDIAEVELMDDGYDPRDFNMLLLEFRESIIIKSSGSKYMLALQPYDDMRRAFRLRRNYFWRKISQTPFTVVVTFPEHFTGRIQIPESEADAMMTQGSNVKRFFKDDFKIHPNWIYCRGIRKSLEEMKLGLIDPDNCEMTPEEELVFYLEKFEESGWKWKQDKLDSNDTMCNRKLMQALLFDAKATMNFPSDFPKRSKEMSFIEKFRIKTSFLATHSGLLRYKIFDKKIRSETFGNKMKKSTDEVWYKHSVEFNRENPQSFVYTVPFNAYEQNDPIITATHTLFIRDGSDQVPLAVVGYQFAHSKLEEMAEQICPRDKEEQCYILDENAYILSDPDAEHTGKFFGSVEKKLMQILIEDRVYEAVRVYDYQAVCYVDRDVDYDAIMKRNSAVSTLLWNPVKNFFMFIITLLSIMYPDPEHFYDESINSEFFCPNIHDSVFMECLKEKEVKTNDTNDSEYRQCLEKKQKRFLKCNDENGTEYILKRHISRTRPTKCDKFNNVYSLTKDESNFLKPYDECSRPFVVQKIAHSNLILLITNRKCNQVFATEGIFNDEPKTIEYDNSTFCHKLKIPMFRSRPKSCMTYHEKEPKFDPNNKDRSQCGSGNKIQINTLITLLSLISALCDTLK
ncbi:CLUMA_CG006775, isoform A [Clunio marinus]|uniref:CLUMA_CG006775, isoform A n=1 Tax=Clunio marinus TaxID=568069 RepID=A0A1J1HYQ7_9DIPT|nr:CLUMA_CG006775, isoform A [Clunio marinus]